MRSSVSFFFLFSRFMNYFSRDSAGKGSMKEVNFFSWLSRADLRESTKMWGLMVARSTFGCSPYSPWM